MRNISRETLTKYAEAHRTSIRKSLEHRLEVARAQGDTELIRMLEAESRKTV